jgi:predicted transcriptional regulator
MSQEAQKLEWLRAAIAEGVADLEAGRVVPSDKLLEEVERGGCALLEARRKRSQ